MGRPDGYIPVYGDLQRFQPSGYGRSVHSHLAGDSDNGVAVPD
jgi:hypothetical protein